EAEDRWSMVLRDARSGCDALPTHRPMTIDHRLFCHTTNGLEPMLDINLSGKRAFIAGVADDGGFGFAIAKALAEAGASITVGTWPPAMGIFENLIERGKIAQSLVLSDGSSMAFERIYPLDAAFDTLEDAPQEIRENK